MPLWTRITLLASAAALLPAQEVQAGVVAVGDNASWATVGAILTGLSYGAMKLLDRTRR